MDVIERFVNGLSDEDFEYLNNNREFAQELVDEHHLRNRADRGDRMAQQQVAKIDEDRRREDIADRRAVFAQNSAPSFGRTPSAPQPTRAWGQTLSSPSASHRPISNWASPPRDPSLSWNMGGRTMEPSIQIKKPQYAPLGRTGPTGPTYRDSLNPNGYRSSAAASGNKREMDIAPTAVMLGSATTADALLGSSAIATEAGAATLGESALAATASSAAWPIALMLAAGAGLYLTKDGKPAKPGVLPDGFPISLVDMEAKRAEREAHAAEIAKATAEAKWPFIEARRDAANAAAIAVLMAGKGSKTKQAFEAYGNTASPTTMGPSIESRRDAANAAAAAGTINSMSKWETEEEKKAREEAEREAEKERHRDYCDEIERQEREICSNLAKTKKNANGKSPIAAICHKSVTERHDQCIRLGYPITPLFTGWR